MLQMRSLNFDFESVCAPTKPYSLPWIYSTFKISALECFLKLGLFVFPFLLFALGSFAQHVEDQLPNAEVTSFKQQHLAKLLPAAAPLYNGKVHRPHPRFKADGHAYLNTKGYVLGSVVYDSVAYANVKIMYDLVRDELLLMSVDGTESIVVQAEHVNYFTLHGQEFVNIKQDQKHEGITAGYHQILYKGRISVFVKRKKELVEQIGQQVEMLVSEKTTYYLLKDGLYTEIKGKQDLMKLLRATNSENQAFIKANNLRFGKDLSQSIYSLVKFHDSILK